MILLMPLLHFHSYFLILFHYCFSLYINRLFSGHWPFSPLLLLQPLPPSPPPMPASFGYAAERAAARRRHIHAIEAGCQLAAASYAFSAERRQIAFRQMSAASHYAELSVERRILRCLRFHYAFISLAFVLRQLFIF